MKRRALSQRPSVYAGHLIKLTFPKGQLDINAKDERARETETKMRHQFVVNA